MNDHRRTPRPPLDLAVIFVASHNERYRNAVAWARTAMPAEWRSDHDRGGIWVGRGWLTNQRVYGPFDKQRELAYGVSEGRTEARTEKPSHTSHWSDV